MSLPVVLLPGQVSIMPKPSPNSITSGDKLAQVGLVDAVDDTGTSHVSAGQYVWYNVTEDQRVLSYGNKNYTIINEDDIICVENPYTPPP